MEGTEKDRKRGKGKEGREEGGLLKFDCSSLEFRVRLRRLYILC